MPRIHRPLAAVEDSSAAVRPRLAAASSGPSTPPTRDPTAADVERWLRLLVDPDHAVELRAPKTPGPGGRRATNVVRQYGPGRLPEMAREAIRLSGRAPAVYFTLNPLTLPLGSGPDGRGRTAAVDDDIARRRWLLIDCDPRRDRAALEAARERSGADGRDFDGLSATDAEKAAAMDKAAAIRDHLAALGWPGPVEADSGNGAHLLYRVDLPNDGAARELTRAVLESLATRFDSPAAEVDRTVFNASRIVKLYGTAARKGEATTDRPHRISRVLNMPRALTPVPRDELEAIAREVSGPRPTAAPPRPGGRGQATVRGGTTIPLDRRVERAAAYLDRCEPAVSGEKGHNRTLKVACRVGPDFDLPEDTAFALLADRYSPRCRPPWPPAELRRKVAEAYKLTKDRGRLLRVPPANGRGGRLAGEGRPHGEGVPPPAAGEDAAAGRGDGRPFILITTDEYDVIDQAAARLAADPNVFQRANALVTVLRDPARARARHVTREPGSPRVVPLPPPRARELLTERARWMRVRPTRDGDAEPVPAHPPDWAVAGVMARGEWPEVRILEAVVEAPTLRPDGTILDRPGYDERTALLYEPNAGFPPVPARPTRDDARGAAGALLRLVVDFPFAGEAHRAAWLASLLTPMARFAIAGPCPLFLFNANTPGAGKSRLADIIALIVTGRDIPRTSYPDADEEMRKRITAIALANDRLMLLDNIASGFGGSALDAALTARTWRDRLLSRSEMTGELPLSTVWYATGNNVVPRGDLTRRIVPCRLESPEERPEERRDFTIPGDLLEYVRRHRPGLAAAALTLLRAHFVAGRPDGGLTRLGSFEAWSDVVRAAVHWALDVDPCEPRREFQTSDPEALALAALIEGWSDLPDGRTGVTAAAALKQVKGEETRFARLHDALMHWSRTDDLPNAQSLGMRLNKIKGRKIDGMVMRATSQDHTQLWRVEFDGARPE